MTTRRFWDARPADHAFSPRILAQALGLLGTAVGLAHAISLPIQIDGTYDDWTSEAIETTDPTGDDGSSGIDFTTLWIANDEQRVFLRFDTTAEVQGDEGQDITLGLDTDQDPNTGQPMAGVGAELVWNLGSRSGTFYGSGGPQPVDHATLGLLLGPTVSDVQLELAFARDATVGGEPLFPGPRFDVAVRDGGGGDTMVLSGAGYAFAQGSQPATPIALDRAAPDDVRIAGYNIQSDGLFDGNGARHAALGRIFATVDPDLWVICEVWNHGASEVAAVVEQLLPSGPGESWSAIKLDSGNVIVTRLPVLDSWLILPGARLTAVLVDLRPAYDSDLLVVANHWSCCTADQNRQEQADALVAFLRDARTPGGRLDLAPDTPIFAAGDFNLVGWRQQLETLETGDIVDEGTYGPDSPPDWDGSDFDDIVARHPEARLTHSWRDDGSSFYPGKLDYVLHTGSVSEVDRSYVLDTRDMTAGTLALYGLNAQDTPSASDHAPLVVDFHPLSDSSGTGEVPPASGSRWIHIRTRVPNPFSDRVEITYELAGDARVDADVFDPQGRKVASLARAALVSAGAHHVVWDGRDAQGAEVVAGRYLVRLRTDQGTASSWVTVLR